MQITAEQVSKLRSVTGAGMMDCKKALTENAGDFDKAIEYLRKKGIASASKKAGRTAKEGAVSAFVDTDHKAVVLVEVNCETDFVGKNENFQKLVENIARHIAKANPSDVTTLLAQKYTGDASKTIEEVQKEAIATMGENISIRRFVRYELASNKAVKTYIHAGGRVGVIVEVALSNAEKAHQAAFSTYLSDLSMHIAAASPLYLKADEVPAETVAKEKEIALAQLQSQNKPADVLEKIAIGKINKYFEETCLVKQKFVKDDKKSVEQLTHETGKALGETLSINRFTRYVLGEGVEVVEETQH
jgi:elongation factor Ts